jgi:cytidylate kinase
VNEQSFSVAIDGPAAAGKSTVGRAVAEALGCRYLDTGLMYRAVTLLGHRNGIDPANGEALTRLAERTRFDLAPDSDDFLVVNGVPMRDELRTPAVDAAVSAVSAHPELRHVLVGHQRQLAASGCIVMVGRDIGTVVLPDAPVKIWVTASARTRAERRNRERADPHDERAIEREMRRIEERDRIDSTRPVSPLRQADDAIVVETDDETPPQTVARTVSLVRVRLHGAAGMDSATR